MTAALLLLLAAEAAAPAAAVPPESAETVAGRILGEKEFPFCRGEGELSPRSREWCQIQAELVTCPGLKALCDKAAKDAAACGGAGASGGSCGPDSAKLSPGDAGGAWDRLKSGVGRLDLSFVLWVVLALVLGGAVAVIVAAVLRRREAPPPAPPLPGAVASVLAAPPGPGDVERLLEQARALAAADPGRALACLYAAVLRRWEEQGLVRWDPSTTNREYVRAVRGRTPLERPARDLVGEVERARFGGRPPGREACEALLARIAPLLARTAALVLLALALPACEGCTPGDPGVEGHAAFVEVLRSQGVKTSRFAMAVEDLGPADPPVFVDARHHAPDAELLAGLERAMLGGARILLALGGEHDLPGWPFLKTAQLASAALVATEALDPAGGPNADRQGTGMAGALPGGWVLVPDEDERDPPEVLVERGGRPFAVRWRTQAGSLTVVADRRLFANAAMAMPADVRLATALALDVAGPSKRLAFAELLHDPAATPVESLSRAGLWPLTAQALAFFALLALARGLAFGTLRDRSRPRRREFREHVQALGDQLARRRGSRTAASLYAAWALERLWQRSGRVVERHDTEALARALALRLGEDEATLAALLRRADEVRRDPGGAPDPPRDLALVRRLGDVLARL